MNEPRELPPLEPLSYRVPLSYLWIARGVRSWLLWVVINAVPGIVAAAAAGMIGRRTEPGAAALAAHLLIIIGLPSLQALWLRTRGVSSARWIIYTVGSFVGACVVGIAALGLLDGAGYEQVGTLTAISTIGVAVGLAQSRAFRTAGIQCPEWVVISAAGWMTGGIIWRLSHTNPDLATISKVFWPEFATGYNEVSLLGMGLLWYGLLTGLAVRRLPVRPGRRS